MIRSLFAWLLVLGLSPAAVVWGQEKQVEAVEPAQPDVAKDLPAQADPEKTDPPAAARSTARTTSKPAAVDSDEVKMHLMDGSLIAGKLAIDVLEVETDFGPLKIPVASIRSFTPGLGSHPQLVTSIERYIENLGSSDFGEREEAQRELLRIGLPAKVYVQKRAEDRDTERKTRIKAILEIFDDLADDAEDEFSESAPAMDRSEMIQRDTVETSEFTLVGRIVPQAFDVTSRYGRLNVKLSDVQRVVRDTGVKPEVRRTFGVDGNHIVMRSNFNTKLRVERGDKISVEAEGSITMTPWGNRAVSTPDGAPNYGWYIPNDIPGGMLIGRIGENGQFIKIGSKSSFTAERTGVLEFAVAMQPDYANNTFPGKYTVKVVVKPKN